MQTVSILLLDTYPFGPGADQFTGFIDNTGIARRMMKLLNLDP